MGVFKKDNNYFIEYRDSEGKRKQEKIGPSKALAEAAFNKRMTERAENKLLGRKTFKKVLFKEFIPRYLEGKPGKREKTLRSDKLSLKHLSVFFGESYLHDITAENVERFKAERGGKPGSINRDLAVLSALLNTAVEWGVINKNPVKIKKLKEEKDRIRYLTLEELKRLFVCLAAHLHDIVKVAILTGMRKGELLALRWQNIDMENRKIFVREEITEKGKREYTKSYRQRTIPISKKLMSVLNELPKEREDLFLHLGDFKKAWLSSLRRAGIKGFRFHDLRGTAASYMIMEGVDIVTVKEILGHQSIDVTMRYIKLAPDLKNRAVEILADKLEF